MVWIKFTLVKYRILYEFPIPDFDPEPESEPKLYYALGSSYVAAPAPQHWSRCFELVCVQVCGLGSIRTGLHSQLQAVPPLAEEFILAEVVPPAGDWSKVCAASGLYTLFSNPSLLSLKMSLYPPPPAFAF
jgi:hypothetical protein